MNKFLERVWNFFTGNIEKLFRLPFLLSSFSFLCALLESKYPGLITNSAMHYGVQVGNATETGVLGMLMWFLRKNKL